MKKGNFSKLVLLSGALAFPAYAEKVEIEQLPSELQEKIRAEVGSARIEDIDRQTKNGKTIYEVGYKKDGQHVESRFEHDESASNAANTSSAGSQKIQYEELPAHIRRVADVRLQGAQVNDVDRRTKDGRTTYEIGFKQNDGAPQQELLIAEDGRVLNEGTSSVASSTSSATSQRPYTPGVRPRANASVSTRPMAYTELPASVRSTAESRLREGDVSRVERIIQNGQISYQIDFKKEDGRTQQLLVAENGRVLRDQFISASAVGAPASVQSGTSSSTQASPYAHITSPVQLLNVQEIRHSQLPVGVERVVRGYTTQANIDEIRRGSWRGQDAYQIGFTDRDNRYVQLQLDANGQVIYDPRGASPASTTGNLINSIGRLFDNN